MKVQFSCYAKTIKPGWFVFCCVSFVLSIMVIGAANRSWGQETCSSDSGLPWKSPALAEDKSLSRLIDMPSTNADNVLETPVPKTNPCPIRQVQYESIPIPAPSPLTPQVEQERLFNERESIPMERLTDPISPVPTKSVLGGNNSWDSSDIDECPDPKSLPKIRELSYKVTMEPGLFPESCPLPDEVYVRKAPTPITFTWKASSLCHKPLYFEDVQLERYGHTCNPLLQPVVSRVRFWLTIPILPYLMGVNPPNECVYELGYYRPGDCAPHMLEPIPLSLRGGLLEAGAVVGVAYLLP